MKLSEYPAWTANIVALVMTFLTMGVSMGWWSLGENQLSSVEAFVKQVSPLLITLYFALAAWWTQRKSIAVARINRIGIQAAMENVEK